MTNNDLLRRLRYILGYNDNKMAGIFAHVNQNKSPEEITAFLLREGEEGFLPVDDACLGSFLDALIIEKRGRRDEKPGQKSRTVMIPRSNNDKLKKLRIAFNLREDAMLDCFEKGGFNIGKSELSALFRKKDHRNYSPCKDQAFRRFLKGLTEMEKNKA